MNRTSRHLPCVTSMLFVCRSGLLPKRAIGNLHLPGSQQCMIGIAGKRRKGSVLKQDPAAQIHTGKMQQNSFLGADVNLWELAQRTKNFSGAEIEGLVKSATSFALNRQVDVNDLSKPIDEDNLKVSSMLPPGHP